MKVTILLDEGQVMDRPYLLRVAGWTEEEFLREAGEDDRWELIDGELIMHSPAKPKHEQRTVDLTVLLGNFILRRDLGKLFGSACPIHLATGRILVPDLCFLSHARAAQETEDWIEAPPDLAVEVTSRSTRNYDRGEKLELYEEHGFGEIWIVDPIGQEVILSGKGRRRRNLARGDLVSKALPGLRLPVEALVAEPMPLADLLARL